MLLGVIQAFCFCYGLLLSVAHAYCSFVYAECFCESSQVFRFHSGLKCGFLSEFRNLGFLSPGILSLGILSVGICRRGFCHVGFLSVTRGN